MRELQTKIPRNKIIRDRYVIEELLGQGGFGAVYRVRDRRVKGNVFALKEINNPNRHQRESFLFEGELLRRLDHPALPRVYRVFEESKCDRICTLMDFIDGPNLERLRLRQPEKRFSLVQVIHMLAPIRNALLYLHAQQPPIIHRDIKPSNIIIPPEEDAVLVDFGIAKEYDEDSTTTAVRHCSPGYGAPEQYISGTSTQTDIYGLGATIYTLLTGSVPIDALYRLTRLSVKHDDPLRPAHELVASIPVGITEVLQRAMSINSADRYETVEEFWDTFISYSIDSATDTDSPSTDPVADLRAPVTTQAEKDSAAIISASIRSKQVPGVVTPVTPVGIMSRIVETPVPTADVVLQSMHTVYSASTETLPTPVLTRSGRSTTLLSAAVSYSDSTRNYAYSALTLALLLLMIAGSFIVYVYAGAHGPVVSRTVVHRSAAPVATIVPTVQVQKTPPALLVAPKSTPVRYVPTPPSIKLVPVIVQPTHIPVKPTPVPAVPTQVPATPEPTPDPSPVNTGDLPLLANSYSGSIHNIPADLVSTMSLSQIQQSEGTITGYFSPGPRLIGAGTFNGLVTKDRHMSFLVASSQTDLPLYFEGRIQDDGSIAGTYCSYLHGSCNQQADGYGTWNVFPVMRVHATNG
jgi:eukaryotic-like serine/threonine-protein kinase